MAASPQSLFDLAACYTPGCLGPTDNAQTLRIGLLLQIANAIAGDTTCTLESGEGSPVGLVTPDFIGQLYDDTTSDSYWRATGLTSADWAEINPQPASTGFVWGPSPETMSSLNLAPTVFRTTFGAANTEYVFEQPTHITNDLTICQNAANEWLTEVTFTLLEDVGGTIEAQDDGNTTLVSLSFPALITVDQLQIQQNGALATISMPSLETVANQMNVIGNLVTELDFPSLVSVGGDLNADSNSSATLANFPVLTTIGGWLVLNDCALTTITIPVWLPTDGTEIHLENNALDAASVNQILARCVAAAVTTCNIDLAGGSNAGLASLSAQGQADAAALILAGNTVSLNA